MRETDGGRGIAVIGGGPVGTVAAMSLAPRYGPVTVLERRADPRAGGRRRGRSITVMLSARGWRMLSELGLEAAVRAICVPIHGRCAHLPDGSSHVTPYSRDHRPIWSVERARLQDLLLDAAEATPGVRLRFGQRVEEIDPEGPAVVVADRDGPRRTAYDRVLGCDGAHSVVRAALVARGARALVRHLELAHQEIGVPAGWLDPWTMHYWPTGDALFAAFPLPSGQFAGSLFMRLDGPAPSFAAAAGGRDLLEMFSTRFGGPAAAIPDLAEQLGAKAVGTITTVRCDRWVLADRLALLGDACHAMAPFMGHGMNCGFEDVRTLVGRLDAAGDWAAALADYEKTRVEDAEAISHLSWEHYHTMANPPPDADAVAGEALRRRLFDLFPDRFVPLYEQCAFTEESYAVLLRDDRRLTGLVEGLLGRYGAGLAGAPDDRLRARVSAAVAGGVLMFVVLFRSRLSAAAGEDYRATDERMAERVREIAGSDPEDIREYTAEDGERLVVLFWRDPETLRKWRDDPEHRAAQRMGSTTWYSSYELTVAEVVRTSAGGAEAQAPPGFTGR